MNLLIECHLDLGFTSSLYQATENHSCPINLGLTYVTKAWPSVLPFLRRIGSCVSVLSKTQRTDSGCLSHVSVLMSRLSARAALLSWVRAFVFAFSGPRKASASECCRTSVLMAHRCSDLVYDKLYRSPAFSYLTSKTKITACLLWTSVGLKEGIASWKNIGRGSKNRSG